MVVEIKVNVQLVAKVIDDHYDNLFPEEEYPVDRIDMGQSSTSVFLIDKKGVYNSVHFKFYIGGREVDIYNSGFFNQYRTANLRGIQYVEQEVIMETRQLRKLKTIVDTYGTNPQIDMMIEEASELTKALLKYRRKSNSESSTGEEMMALRDAVIDEIADTKIMLAQMEILFGCAGEVEVQIDRKINRQIDRLEEHKINLQMDMLGNRSGVNESQSV